MLGYRELPLSGDQFRRRMPKAQAGPRKRSSYSAAFKLKVVRSALQRPPGNRIKPTCRQYPGIEPVIASLSTRIPPYPRARADLAPRFRGRRCSCGSGSVTSRS